VGLYKLFWQGLAYRICYISLGGTPGVGDIFLNKLCCLTALPPSH